MMKPCKPYLSDDHTTLIRMLSPVDAAQFLCQHLGEDVPHWLHYLREDRHPGLDECDRELPYDCHDGEYWYDMRNLYRFVALRNPGALGIATRDGGRSSLAGTFMLDVIPSIDFANGCKLVPEFLLPERFMGRAWMTPDETRALARAMLEIADWCDSHSYDPYDRVCKSKSTVSSDYASAKGEDHE